MQDVNPHGSLGQHLTLMNVKHCKIFLDIRCMKTSMIKTGCLKPCKFREYLIAGVTSKLRNYSLVDLNGKYCTQFIIASSILNKKKETYVYPAISFVSEIGGSLGLFVGFSFLSIWDWFDPIFDHLISKKSITFLHEE